MITKIGKKILFYSLLVFGIYLIINPILAKNNTIKTTNKYTINNISKESIEKNKERLVDYNWEELEEANNSVKIELKNSESSLPVIGGITIPSLSLNLPIFIGTSNEAMSYGAGTIKEQEMGKGNYSLVSHTVFDETKELLFSPLERAEVNNKIYLTDKDYIYEYIITEKFIVNPEDVYVIDDIPNKNIITLVTCTNVEATQRLIVRGNFIKKYVYSKAPKEAVDGFNFEYKFSTKYLN